MVKKIIISILIVSAIISVSITIKLHNSNSILPDDINTKSEYSFTDSDKTEALFNKPMKTITYEPKPEDISEYDAIELCEKHLGKYASQTGFQISYLYIDTAVYDNETYYVIKRSKLVENDWVFINYAMISVDGNKVYEGTDSKDGTYYLCDLMWSDKVA